MKNLLRWAGIVVASAAIVLAGCSSSSSDSPVAPVAPAAVTFSGTAATGAAFTGAVITVLDSRGVLVGTSEPVGDDGAYTVTLDAGAVAPFVIIASRTNADGQVDSMVSVADSAESTTLNVTPVTTLIASLLSPSGDPLKLATELQAGTAQISAASVSATVAEVKQILAPILAATGTSDFNPMNSAFATDGTGFDRLLDSISIKIIPATETSANIEIGVKTTDTGDDSAPPVIQFKSDDSVESVITANSITPTSVGGSTVTTANLVEAGTSVLIGNFLQELTSCYAVPFADRVSGVSGTMTAVVGTASAVIAPACRNVFHDNDPATFRNNGGVVQRTPNNTGAFASLFRSGATGVVFSQGTYEFTRENGDLVIGYKSRDTSGGELFDTLVVRKGSDGKLRLIGNQYLYPGSVSAYHQLRQFPTLGQSAYNYYSSGYTLHVDNQQFEGNPRFNRVEVTTPTGNTVTIYPSTGASFLVFKKSGVATGTNFIRLGSAFVDTALTAAPSTIDTTSLFFASPQRTEEQLAAIPAQSAWTFKYFLHGNAGSTPDATQYYKTRARTLTIGELRLKGFAALVPEILSNISTEANPTFGTLALDVDQPLNIETDGGGNAWSVPVGALPPTQVRVFGRYGAGPTVSFDDSVNFQSTARKTVVQCSAASDEDLHCSGTVAGAYGPNVNMNGLHLWARDTDGREYANFYAMYQLNIAP